MYYYNEILMTFGHRMTLQTNDCRESKFLRLRIGIAIQSAFAHLPQRHVTIIMFYVFICSFCKHSIFYLEVV